MIAVFQLIFIPFKDPVFHCVLKTVPDKWDIPFARENDPEIRAAEAVSAFDPDLGLCREALAHDIVEQRLEHHQVFRGDLFADPVSLQLILYKSRSLFKIRHTRTYADCFHLFSSILIVFPETGRPAAVKTGIGYAPQKQYNKIANRIQ